VKLYYLPYEMAALKRTHSESGDSDSDAPEETPSKRLHESNEAPDNDTSDDDASGNAASDDDAQDDDAPEDEAPCDGASGDEIRRKLTELAAPDDDAPEEDAPDDEFLQLRKELSDMPFEDLQKLKEKIGTKMFSQAMSSGKKSEKHSGNKSGSKSFKRTNKNRPMEMSSKKPVKIIRDHVKKNKCVTRDPRFDDLSGEYSETFFNTAYSFIGDVKQREKEKLEGKLKKEKDPENKEKLQFLINRMTQQEKSERQKEQRQEQEQKFKKQERELVKEGKTPFYLKKSDKKTLELAEKFKELSKSGKVDKFLMKKRKKNAAKDRKKLPPMAQS